MEQTPKRFYIRSELIGIAEIISAVLLFLSGYAAGDDRVWYAAVIGAAYAAFKNFTERCYPSNPVPPTPTNDDPDDDSETTPKLADDRPADVPKPRNPLVSR